LLKNLSQKSLFLFGYRYTYIVRVPKNEMEKQARIPDFTQEFSWHNYNESQTREKSLFLVLLKELCGQIDEPEHQKGRKPKPLRDIVYAVCLKTYNNTSSRRVQSDLRTAKELGHMSTDIAFNTLLDSLERCELKPLLRRLIELSAMPLAQIEADFAIDGTGFSTSRYETFFGVKHQKKERWKSYRKCHAVCGVHTNVIVAVDITKGYQPDITKFEELAKDTARNFTIRDFLADKGYLSKANYNLIRDLGGVAFIPFKINSTGKSRQGGDSKTWRDMFRYFREHQDEFYSRYHKRSNIESCFSMIKRKFGNNVKCKKEVSQDNEDLAKILCHNICVLIQEMFLNGIEVNFKRCRREYIER